MSIASASSLSASAILPKGIQLDDIKPLWSSFYPIASRELPFALTKFLVFDLASSSIANLINGSNLLGDDEIQVGVGGLGLLLSAFAGALAGRCPFIVFVLTKFVLLIIMFFDCNHFRNRRSLC
jgi:hypothetical protein